MAAAIVPRQLWCPPPGAETYNVSVHNLRTVAPCYGELLALLVYLTWLLHWFSSSNPTSFRAFLCLKDFPLYSVRGTLQYVAAPLLVPAQGSSCWWLLDRVWAALISTHMYDIFSTYTRVLGSVSIHNLRTVAPCYGELLALLVYLTYNNQPRPFAVVSVRGGHGR